MNKKTRIEIRRPIGNGMNIGIARPANLRDAAEIARKADGDFVLVVEHTQLTPAEAEERAELDVLTSPELNMMTPSGVATSLLYQIISQAAENIEEQLVGRVMEEDIDLIADEMRWHVERILSDLQ